METFVVSALKYRPQTFEEVVGQKAITQTLDNAIAKNQLAQALLFCGPRGVGKTSCARILAKKINSQGKNDADQDFAFNIFELDDASNNSVDDIRSLNEKVRIPPQVGTHKIYIIDEVHMLSIGAFNAFLKTLEEPPKHVIFILATTEKQKIIPTILSRCQTYDFKRISVADCKEHLKKIAEDQKIQFEEEALDLIAQKADGAMRDALSIYDRMVSFSNQQLTVKSVSENLNVLDHETFFSVTSLILKHDIPALLLAFDELLQKGFDEIQFVSGLGLHFRNLMVSKENSTLKLLEVSNTEFTIINEGKRISSKSFKIGTVRLINDLVDDRVWKAIQGWIEKNAKPYRKITLIGSGGNINKLFKLSNIKEGKPLSLIKLNQIYLELESLTYEERLLKFELNPDRADVIIPAAKIYLKSLEWSGGQKIYVPKFGLSDGMIKYMYKNGKKKI